MIIDKKNVFTILKQLNYKVMQEGNNIFAEFPTITFREDVNTPTYTLDKEIGLQKISYVVDIWSEKSTDNTKITKEVELMMRENDYFLQYKYDIGQDNGIYHTSMRFEKII